jgi:hypothetical protein
MLHCKPLQQSAFVVHAAAEGRQEDAAQIRGGVPLELGTQGRLLQQSAEDAQAWPEAPHTGLRHRFTPIKSGPQESTFCGLPLQQSFPDVPPHRLPFGLQPTGVLHRPALIPAVMVQVTGVPPPAPYEPVLPQHAASAVQRSWVTLQPLGAWQAMPPPGTLAQSWPQQSLLAAQGSPSTAQVVATKSDNGSQMPPLAPRSHWPLQQSESAEQRSESAWQPMVPLALMQVLPLQVTEQQSLADPQLLPSARHRRSNPSGKISSLLLVFAISETVAAGCSAASTRGARAPVALSSRRRRLFWDASLVSVAVASICRTLGAGAGRTADSTAFGLISAGAALPACANGAAQNAKTKTMRRNASRVHCGGTQTMLLMTTRIGKTRRGNDAVE